MPRRIVSILEGESLVNDATALVALNTSIAAITATISPWHVGWDFVREAGGGVLIGLVAAFVLAQIRKLITDAVLDTTLSFAAPYVAFLPAQEIKSSGVLAVVVCGLLLGHRAPVLQTASSRIAENINWRTVQFLLENVVFLLIGLQIRDILDRRPAHRPAMDPMVDDVRRRARGDDPRARRVDVRRQRRAARAAGGEHLELAGQRHRVLGRHARRRHARRGVPAADRHPAARPADPRRVHRRGRHVADPGADAALGRPPGRICPHPTRPRTRCRARASSRTPLVRAWRSWTRSQRRRPARGARGPARTRHRTQQPHLGAAGPLAGRARTARRHLPPTAAA